ncbi:MAG: hypothetical protein HFI37_02665 [Lachnospiraceae bacterium]|nr:hypothetical protein [Lachnospiraceae bacterium]
MGPRERMFLGILILNTLVVLGYFVWVTVFSVTEKERKGIHIRHVFCALIMLFCPVVGPLFFLAGKVFYFVFFYQDVDLEDVIFSKERVKTSVKADEERERNIVPLEEAIAVSDKNSLRTLMLNVVRGDVQKSLTSIALALNSEDSETSHYAASVLRDELNDFREKSQKIYLELQNEKENEKRAQYAPMLIEYMNGVLKQKVFGIMEQKYFVGMLEKAGEIFYQCKKEAMQATHFEIICLRLMEIKNFEICEMWCKRGKEEYPDELSSYTCMLKLYFATQQREAFFRELEELKKSKIVLNNETLELIRTFS